METAAQNLVAIQPVLEHTLCPEAARGWLSGLAQVTRPGGYVTIVMPKGMGYGQHFWDDWECCPPCQDTSP